MPKSANKLYTINTATWSHEYSLLVRNTRVGEQYEAPMPCYLIEHPEGLVLVEAGISPELQNDPENYGPYGAPELEGLLEGLKISEEQKLPNRLSELGYSPSDIDFVVFSHLHLDHGGYITELPYSEYVIQESELQYAFWPTDSFQHKVYQLGDYGILRSNDYDVTPISGRYDIFGDGSIECLPMPGHTPGHQVVKLQLAEAGTIILGGDIAHTREGFDKELGPSFNWNSKKAVESMRKLKNIAKREKARIILQHEMEDLKNFPEFPESLK